MGQMVQLVGAMIVVCAYVAYQKNRLRLDSVQFLGMNMVGAGILTVVAAVNGDYGFLLLEGMWTWVSGRGFRRALKARQEAKRKAASGRSRRPGSRPGRRRHLRRV
jgi:hypothetical protein